MGTTLSANPLQFAALTANLSQVMTEKAYGKMIRGAGRLHQGLARVVDHHELEWHVVHLGARVEFICAKGPLANGAEAMRAHAPLVERALHIGLLNRGSLIAPFHNMMLISPVTSSGQIDHLIAGFDDVIATIRA
jgi:glutamate-1-semialdehyde 2,1-aminomutase